MNDLFLYQYEILKAKSNQKEQAGRLRKLQYNNSPFKNLILYH